MIKDLLRMDGWLNVLTGFGGVNDKRLATVMGRGRVLSEDEIANLFRFNDLARLIVEVVPETGMMNGWELQIPNAKDELKTQVAQRFEELDVWDKLADTFVWGRAYGGGLLVLGVNDGKSMESEVDWEKVETVDYVLAMDKRDLKIEEYEDDPTSASFGLPRLYKLWRQTAVREARLASGELIHASRVIRGFGARTGDRERLELDGWDDSILQAPYQVLRDFGIGWDGASLLLQEASQAVYKVKGLNEILASKNGEQRMQTRFRMIEMGRSIMRALVMDAEGEEFERKPTQFTGVPDLLQQFATRLSAATRIPVTILMGQAPAGLNATGASDLRTWEANVKRWQTMELKPAMEKLVRLFLLEATQGKEPKNWKVHIRPPYQATEAETANIRQQNMTTDTGYIDRGVLTAEEVALSRWRPEGYSSETTIDYDLRTKLSDIKEEGILEAAESGGSNDVAQLGTAGAQVDALQKITDAVATGTISQETGVARVVALFKVTTEQAKSMLGEIEVAPPPAAVGPDGQPLPPEGDEDPEADALLAEADKAVGAREDAYEPERAKDGTFGSGEGIRGPAQPKEKTGNKPAMSKEARAAHLAPHKDELRSAIDRFKAEPTQTNHEAVLAARESLLDARRVAGSTDPKERHSQLREFRDQEAEDKAEAAKGEKRSAIAKRHLAEVKTEAKEIHAEAKKELKALRAERKSVEREITKERVAAYKSAREEELKSDLAKEYDAKFGKGSAKEWFDNDVGSGRGRFSFEEADSSDLDILRDDMGTLPMDTAEYDLEEAGNVSDAVRRLETDFTIWADNPDRGSDVTEVSKKRLDPSARREQIKAGAARFRETLTQAREILRNEWKENLQVSVTDWRKARREELDSE